MERAFRFDDTSGRAKGPAVSLSYSWQFIGRPGSVGDRAYDWLRRRLNRRLVGWLTKHLGRSTPGSTACRLLEAGSGTAFASSLFRRQPHVDLCVCLDIDEEALHAARRRDPQLLAVRGDLQQMPFSGGMFTLVFSSSTVEHLADPAAAVGEMQRVCHDGGCVFVGVPYRFGPLGFQPWIRHTRIGIWLGPVFTRRSLERILNRTGLSPVAHLRYFWNFFVGVFAVKAGLQDALPTAMNRSVETR